MKLRTQIVLVVIGISIWLFFVGSILYIDYKENNRIKECENKYSGCEIYKCKAEEVQGIQRERNYLIQEQNCLLKLTQSDIKEKGK